MTYISADRFTKETREHSRMTVLDSWQFCEWMVHNLRSRIPRLHSHLSEAYDLNSVVNTRGCNHEYTQKILLEATVLSSLEMLAASTPETNTCWLLTTCSVINDMCHLIISLPRISTDHACQVVNSNGCTDQLTGRLWVWRHCLNNLEPHMTERVVHFKRITQVWSRSFNFTTILHWQQGNHASEVAQMGTEYGHTNHICPLRTGIQLKPSTTKPRINFLTIH